MLVIKDILNLVQNLVLQGEDFQPDKYLTDRTSYSLAYMFRFRWWLDEQPELPMHLQHRLQRVVHEGQQDPVDRLLNARLVDGRDPVFNKGPAVGRLRRRWGRMPGWGWWWRLHWYV